MANIFEKMPDLGAELAWSILGEMGVVTGVAGADTLAIAGESTFYYY